MKTTLLCLVLLGLSCAINCPDGKQYAHMIKKNPVNYANEEVVIIKSNGVEDYRTPALEKNCTMEFDICLTSTTNSQYTITLYDTYGDSWSSDSWVEIRGEYGNVVFKYYLVSYNSEEYALSLYYAIRKEAQWKMIADNAGSNWTQVSFSDASWTQVTLGSSSIPAVTGTQYFRKAFTGLTGMAAYELSMKYRYGIVAYINGAEIYRDNMPEGTVTSTTPSTGGYSSVDFHSIIRPGVEVATTSSVLALEIHYTNTDSHNVDFDAFLAPLAPDVIDTLCFAVTEGAEISSDDAKAMDYNKSTSIYHATPLIVDVTYTSYTPFVNGMMVFTSSSSLYPTTLSWGGRNTLDELYHPIRMKSGLKGETRKNIVVYGYFNSGLYKNYQVSTTRDSGNIYIYELHPLVCSMATPSTIEYNPSSLSFFSIYEEVSVSPFTDEFVNCQIAPALPQGVTMDVDTCVISGIASVSSPLTTYTVTSTMYGATYTGTVSIEFKACTTGLIDIHRIYKTTAQKEAFTVKDAVSQQVLINVDIDSGQQGYTESHLYVCSTSGKFTLTLQGSAAFWQALSSIRILGALDPNNYDVIVSTRYDTNNGLPSTIAFDTSYLITSHSTWSYKMGTVPANWYNNEMTAWTETSSVGSFPDSTNQLQIYKKQFTVASIGQAAGIVMSLQYQYGAIVYLNGHEVFRKGVSAATLTESTVSTTESDTVFYHQISLPIRSMKVDDNPTVDYIQQGQNTIAIALVANNNQQKTSVFDCALRFMGDMKENRVLHGESTITKSNVDGNSPTSINTYYYGYYLKKTSCVSNYVQFTFKNDRREWVSSVGLKLYYSQTTQQPTKFVLKAKNPEDSTWTTLKTVTGMTWSLKGQENRIWIMSNKPYNIYKFENFHTGTTSTSTTYCTWQLGSIFLYSDHTGSNIPALTYESASIYKDIEMGEVYPSSSYYENFSIQPALPQGITIDPNSGIISGTASEMGSAVTYTITAKRFTGDTVTTPFTMNVDVCTGGKSLITLVIRTDYNPSQGGYSLHAGKDTTSDPLREVTGFAVSANLMYGDFCLNHGIYTLEFTDTAKDGWANPAGYYLSVDVGEMKFEMGQVHISVASVTTMFSSLLPFQIEYDDWKVYAGEVPQNWNTVDYDDSTWTVTKAANIGKYEAVTVYIRREVTIPDINEYHVLNVRVKYAGGVVAYFNGRKVARFNLKDSFDAETESIEVHDSTTFSKFHVILPTAGAVTGKNVIAFEIHRPKGQSSAEPVVFDATGVFGVNDCSIAVDTYSQIEGTTPASGSLANFFDLTTVTFGYLPNSVGSYMEWTVENLEGSGFNGYAWQIIFLRNNWGFSLYMRNDPEDEYVTGLERLGEQVMPLQRKTYDVPLGIASFKQFRYEMDAPASSTLSFSAHFFVYCKPTGEGVCEGVGDYPTVGNGQISPSSCEYGFRGYSYRECENGVFSEVKTDKCIYKSPEDLRYKEPRYSFVMDTNVKTDAPTFTNLITRFHLLDNVFLPDGLELDETTGVISGVPTTETSIKTFTVYGENPSGVVSTTINLSVRKGECKSEGNFQKTYVGELAKYECALQGSYVGTQTRACILGEEDGEWQKIQGVCVAVATIVAIVLVVLIIIIVVVILIVRTSKKTVGGTKTKKIVKKTKAKQSPSKNVKV